LTVQSFGRNLIRGHAEGDVGQPFAGRGYDATKGFAREGDEVCVDFLYVVAVLGGLVPGNAEGGTVARASRSKVRPGQGVYNDNVHQIVVGGVGGMQVRAAVVSTQGVDLHGRVSGGLVEGANDGIVASSSVVIGVGSAGEWMTTVVAVHGVVDPSAGAGAHGGPSKEGLPLRVRRKAQTDAKGDGEVLVRKTSGLVQGDGSEPPGATLGPQGGESLGVAVGRPEGW